MLAIVEHDERRPIRERINDAVDRTATALFLHPQNFQQSVPTAAVTWEERSTKNTPSGNSGLA